MYGCESWTIKKAECRRTNVFELWCWRRLLRVPWIARRFNQSFVKEISQSWIFIGRTDAKAEVPILWPPDVKNCLLWEDPDAGKDWRQVDKGMTEDEVVGWHQATLWTWVWTSSGRWWRTGKPGMVQSVGLQRVWHDWTEQNWIWGQWLCLSFISGQIWEIQSCTCINTHLILLCLYTLEP